MSFVAVPNCAEFVVRGTVDAQEINNTFYGVHTTTFDLSMLTVAAGILSDQWVADILPYLSSNYRFLGVHGRGLRSAVDIETDYVTGSAPGGVDAEALPNNVALAIKRITGLAGRSARGRVYIGGIPNSVLSTANTVETVFASHLVTGLNSISPAWVAADWLEVIVSRVTNGVPNTPPISRLVTEYLCADLTVDSMRARLPRH